MNYIIEKVETTKSGVFYNVKYRVSILFGLIKYFTYHTYEDSDKPVMYSREEAEELVERWNSPKDKEINRTIYKKV